MATYYDDNYGHYDIDSQEDVDFYWERQRTNVRKQCQGCNRWVNIQPDYAYCNSCADKIECGYDCEGE